MQDITDLVLEYREAKRHLWNTCFRSQIGAVFDCNLSRYEEIDWLLFISLVLEPIGKAQHKFSFREDALPFLHIQACEDSTALRLRFCDPPVSKSRSWNEAISVSGVNDAIFELIELFDWDRYSWVNYPYYRVKIRSFPNEPHLENLEALVEVQAVRIYNISA